MAAADMERSAESAIAMDSIFSLKEEQTTALKALADKKDVCAVLLIGFGKSLV